MRLIYACLSFVCAASVISACGGGDEFKADGAGAIAGDGTQDQAGAPSDTGGSSSQPGGGSSQTGGSASVMGGESNGGVPASAGAPPSDGGAAGAGGAPTPPECVMDTDCDTTRGGPSHCGAWQCVAGVCGIDAPNCTDADGDGYGVGASCACAGLDCDDGDDTVADSLQASCYTGKAGTLGVGTCQGGQSVCAAGVWGPCVGEVTSGGEACNTLDDDCNGTPDDQLGHFTCGIGACKVTIAACVAGAVSKCVPSAPAAQNDSACNGIDDDCDGAIDEDCSCVRVAAGPLGNNATGDGAAVPFADVQPAIDWAVAHPNGPQRVCVASGAACGANATFTNAPSTTITMANGVSVYGKYQSTTWARCPTSVTTLQPQTAAGVTFPSSVSSITVLDGFKVDRLGVATTAGVTVDGAKNVILSDVSVTNVPAVTNSYGVNIINGGDAIVTRSHIDAGTGSAESIGVRSIGSKVSVEDNCLSPDPISGRCDDSCGGNPSIRGRTTTGPGVTYAVLLDTSPGSKVERSALCSIAADTAAMIRVKGDATGLVIRGNYINAFGGAQDSHGIWLEDCAGAAPWIVDNQAIYAGGTNQQSRVDGVRAVGDCHPVVDRNVLISGGGEGQTSNPTAVHCLAAANGTPSRCVVDGNLALNGSNFGFPTVATGVRCEGGSCVKITNNVISGRGGLTSYGVWLGKTGAFVANNLVRGGCSPTAVGAYADDSYARLENNRIFGYTANDCLGGGNPPTVKASYGLQAFTTLGPNELDVHSNFIDGTGTAGNQGNCSSYGVALDVKGAAPTTPVGLFRNNIFRAGTCQQSRTAFAELDTAADPRIFEHNDFDPAGAPTTFYFNENASALNTPAAVNALIDMTSFGNISADPQFANYPSDVHLQAGSMCIAAGTSNGAPKVDMDGAARDPATPDIGPDEH
jgi:hypothetical protein